MSAIFECKNLGSILDILSLPSTGVLVALLISSGCRKMDALHVHNLQNYRIQGLQGTVLAKVTKYPGLRRARLKPLRPSLSYGLSQPPSEQDGYTSVSG